MRRKQVLALLLTGALTVGMAPAAAFAAEDVSTFSIEDAQAAGLETAAETPEEAAPEVSPETTEPEASGEVPEEIPTEAPTEEPIEAPTEAPAETVPEAPTVAPAETPTEAPTVAPTESPAAETPATAAEGNLQAAPEAQEPTPAETQAAGPFTLGDKAYDTLAEAIAASTATKGGEEDIILVNQDMEIGETVSIPENKNITLAAAVGKNIKITRKAGFTGNMFEVKGSILSIGGGIDTLVNGEDANGTLTVNGAGDGSVSNGSIVSVTSGGEFYLIEYGTLTGNSTSANGSAVSCESGIVSVSGGSITGNSTTGEGGAIYSDSTVYVGDTVNISGNTGADGAANNIVLNNSSEGADEPVTVCVLRKLNTSSAIGVKLLNPNAGLQAVSVSSATVDTTLAEALAQFTYDDSSFTLNQEGCLAAAVPEDGQLDAEITDAAWFGLNKVQISAMANKAGKAYIKVVKQGSEEPSAEEIKAANPDSSSEVKANETFTIEHVFSDEEKKAIETSPVTVYLYVEDTEGNESIIIGEDMDEVSRPARVRISDGTWIDHTSAKVVFQSDKAGTYYVEWVKRGEAAPEVDFTQPGTAIKANEDTAVELSGLDSNSAIDVYVYVKSDNSNVATTARMELNEESRPAATVPTATPTVTPDTPTPTPDVEPTTTPKPTAPTLQGKSVKWNGHNWAQIVCVTDKDGSYYSGWTVRSADGKHQQPDIDFSKDGIPVYANTEFTVDINDITSDEPIDAYVCVKAKDGSYVIRWASLDQNSRPKASTPSRDPLTPDVSESKVSGLEEPLEFYPNTFYDFTVIGAGTDNDDPIEGDTRWVPLYWSMVANPSDADKHTSWKIGAKGGIKTEGTYNLYIFFRQDRYNGSEWQPTSNVVSQTYQFMSAAIDFALTPTPTAAPGYYYNENGELVEREDDTEDTGSTTSAGAKTADESPIGTMSVMAMLSLLAGGYVITRKRKKMTD